VPFSKRQAKATAVRASFQAQRASTLQIASARSAFAVQTALPLIQMAQLQGGQFQTSFSASAYRSRFTLFGPGRIT
jgi:hypothetical protein